MGRGRRNRPGPNGQEGQPPQKSGHDNKNDNNSLAKITRHKTEITKQVKLYQGPIPSPSLLAEYENLWPGEGQKILDRFHKQSDHRMELEKIVVKAGARDSLLGIISALVLGLASLVCGALVVIFVSPGAGATISGLGITVLGGTFVFSTRSRRKERETKARMMEEA